jgi:lipopolysaccharide transport system ATP-binding protein
MTNSVISVENVSKCYLVGHQSAQRERYNSFRDLIGLEARKFGRKVGELTRGQNIVEGDDVEEFWALKDVNLEVNRGDVLGVVGRNGSGKSTLLKILSRITEPTQGRIKIRGRVASLLEVGTGFHPELTGRENIFLNGAILGMTQNDIRTRLDEIVAFAEVERFLDTPVKRYSSGMYVRLAFAVAAHLEPEIVLVDEVLAVGDAAFQRKCLQKLESVAAGEGRTVIFISHNTSALLTLCERGVLLKNGSVALDGKIDDVLKQYTSLHEVYSGGDLGKQMTTPSITAVSMDREALNVGDLVVDISFESPFPLDSIVASFAINTSFGSPVFGSRFSGQEKEDLEEGFRSGVIRFVVRQMPLVGGLYTISVRLGDGQTTYDRRWDVLAFEFGAKLQSASEPSKITVGHMQWPVSWQVSWEDPCST